MKTYEVLHSMGREVIQCNSILLDKEGKLWTFIYRGADRSKEAEEPVACFSNWSKMTCITPGKPPFVLHNPLFNDPVPLTRTPNIRDFQWVRNLGSDEKV